MDAKNMEMYSPRNGKSDRGHVSGDSIAFSSVCMQNKININ